MVKAPTRMFDDKVDDEDGKDDEVTLALLSDCGKECRSKLTAGA